MKLPYKIAPLAVLALASFAFTGTAAAQTTSTLAPTEFCFGLQQPGSGQHLRMSVVLAQPGGTALTAAVTVNLLVRDASGNELGRSVQTLLPGRAVSVDTRSIIGVLRAGGAQASIYMLVGPEIRNLIIGVLDVVDDATGRVVFSMNNPRLVIGPEITPVGAYPPGPSAP